MQSLSIRSIIANVCANHSRLYTFIAEAGHALPLCLPRPLRLAMPVNRLGPIVPHSLSRPIGLLAWLTLMPQTLQAQPSTPSPAERGQVELPAVTIAAPPLERPRAPGSLSVLEREDFDASQPFTVNEMLRKLPGVHVRDEEGFGLRPNIGVRGLNPTRSTKITLLEDGIPLAYAPYGDNASYYFPPVERFASIELLKGLGTLAYGPQTLGGVLNFLTPAPTREPSGSAQLTVGNRAFRDVKLQASAEGWLVDLTHKQGQGSRENTESDLLDFNLKRVIDLAPDHRLTAKLSHFIEESQVTYSGLTQAEFDTFGAQYNPFRNDVFETSRTGLSLTHRWKLGPGRTLSTQLYGAVFERDWWRQSSTTTDTQCGTAFRDARLAGERVDVERCASAQGRLRYYRTLGIDSRLRLQHALGGWAQELEFGVKLHDELQERKQVQAGSPRGRSGPLVEDNLRETRAASAFLSNRIALGEAFSLQPVLRFEHIINRREDRLGDLGPQSDTLRTFIPGLGVAWRFSPESTLFASVHRGFAPPRTEDVIAGNGTVTEVAAERSLNVEVGLRSEPLDGLSVQATAFRTDFDRLTAVGSIAGGSTPLAQGQALFQGLELSGQWAFAPSAGAFTTWALTWLPTARQSEPFRQVVGGAPVAGSAAGLRQPYAPEYLATVTMGVERPAWRAQLEAVYTSAQFADFANTVAPSANGQAGRIPAHTVINLAGSWRRDDRWSLLATVKNLLDAEDIVDRTRGILTGPPRRVHLGLRATF